MYPFIVFKTCVLEYPYQTKSNNNNQNRIYFLKYDTIKMLKNNAWINSVRCAYLYYFYNISNVYNIKLNYKNKTYT